MITNLMLLVTHMLFNFDYPIAEKQDLAVDITQIDESLSYNETT